MNLSKEKTIKRAVMVCLVSFVLCFVLSLIIKFQLRYDILYGILFGVFFISGVVGEYMTSKLKSFFLGAIVALFVFFSYYLIFYALGYVHEMDDEVLGYLMCASFIEGGICSLDSTRREISVGGWIWDLFQ